MCPLMLASAGWPNQTRRAIGERARETQVASPASSTRAGSEAAGQRGGEACKGKYSNSPLSSTSKREDCRTMATDGAREVGVEKEVVLVGNAAGFSAALDSRQAAAKRQSETGEQRTTRPAV
jgi:hypothetical protein